MSRRHSMENLELLKLTPDKISVSMKSDFQVMSQSSTRRRVMFLDLSIFLIPVSQAQKWTSDILFKQPKSTLAKSSTRLSFVNRLRGKKHKLQSSSSKVLQDTSNTRETPQNKVQKPHTNAITVEHTIVATMGCGAFVPDIYLAFQSGSTDVLGDEGFFDLLSRFQSNRMDDQRCAIQDGRSHLSVNPGPSSPPNTPPGTIRKCK